ncbi:MAG: hypothetical protein EBT92_08435 [Planctomycetes bacterium]|nr:hypothetical protein [Planctomycetota bacterium]
MEATSSKKTFWDKYSPNYESISSLIVSFVVHIALVVLIMMLGWEGLKKAIVGDVNRRLGVSSVRVGGSASSGEPDAKANDDTIKVFSKVKSQDKEIISEIPLKLDPSPIEKIQVDKNGVKSLVDDAKAKAQELSRIGQNLKNKMIDGMKGIGNTKGGGVGDGRGERMLRWIMVFNTTNGADYLLQLMDLNARVAFPDPNNPGKFLVISNLSVKPLSTMELDLSSVSDIFWIDDKPQSVSNLSRALGLQIKTEAFVVLMPLSVEEKLLKLEKASLQGAKEEDIQETRFAISKTSGKYEPAKADITYKKK